MRRMISDVVGVLFTDHPHSVGETYGEHLRFTVWAGRYLLKTAAIAVAHGLVPSTFTTTAADRVRTLTAIFETRRARSKK